MTDLEEEFQTLEKWQLPGPTWKGRALLFLEQGRARGLLDLLIAENKVDATDLQRWSKESYQRRLLVATLGLHDADYEAARKQAAARMGANLDELSKIQADLEKQSLGMASMLPPAGFGSNANALYHSIPSQAVVVHINLASDGLLLFGITSNGIEDVHQGDATDLEVQRAVLRYLKLLNECSRNPAKRVDSPEYTRLVTLISTMILEPLADLVSRRSHVIFVPSHTLNKFPFSALILAGRPLFLGKQRICKEIKAGVVWGCIWRWHFGASTLAGMSFDEGARISGGGTKRSALTRLPGRGLDTFEFAARFR